MTSTAAQQPATAPATSPLGRLRSRPTLVHALVLASLAIAIWGPSVFTHGRYYDDWAILAYFDDLSERDPVSVLEECVGDESAVTDPEGRTLRTRPGACIYHAAVDLATGERVRAYHLLSVGLIWAGALLLYLLLARCRLPRGAALGVAALWIVFPASDATRLWPTGVVGQAVMTLYLVAVFLGVAALKRDGRAAIALHAGSLLIYLALFFTYEIVIPLIAIAGVFYWLAAPGRRATVRGAVDLALAVALVGYRLVISPVNPETGFTVERTTGEQISRALDIARAAWATWQDLFLPGTAGALLAGLAAVVVAVAAAARPDARRRIALSLAVALGAAVVVAAALVAYLPANDYYLPQVFGTFNRLNLAAAPAYCLGFAALVAAVYFAVRSLAGLVAATAVAAAIAGGVVAWQLDVGAQSRASWRAAWDAQTAAIHGITLGLRDAPANASVISFGHPIWEQGFVPVFAATWDLRGMIDFHTHIDPPHAAPFLPSVGCGAEGIELDGVTWVPYAGDSPLWFVNAATQESRRIGSAKGCRRAVEEWGAPPQFAAGA